MRHLRNLSVFLVFCISLYCVSHASAAVIINVYEAAGTTYIEWGDGAGGPGSLITAGLPGSGSSSTVIAGGVYPYGGALFHMTGSFDIFGWGSPTAFSSVPPGPPPGWIGGNQGVWQTGFNALPGTSNFGVFTAPSGELYLPGGYVSGSATIQGGLFRPGLLSSAGFDTSQDHVWTLNNSAADTIVMTFSAPVPEPSTFALAALGLLGSAMIHRSRIR
ncbi:MAG: PEP-CTERM sorting domain-containing protein [Planctomycetales bacterium]|nr:PEP-CTERM sorting domain-containing protein [Planctomycetales bacterium]